MKRMSVTSADSEEDASSSSSAPLEINLLPKVIIDLGTHKLETANKHTGIENAETRLIFAAPNRAMKDRWINSIANLIGKTMPPPV